MENLLQSLLNLNLSFDINKISLVDSILQIKINNVTSGEYMANIHVLNEGLHSLGSLFYLLLGHGLCDFSRVPCEPCYQTVGEALVTVSIVKSLDDNGLLSGVSASEHDNNFSCLCWEERVKITT